MTAEEERTRLIGDIARVLRDGPVPDEARKAALTFIGWLARRMPGEPVSRCDIRLCKGFATAMGGPCPRPVPMGGDPPYPLAQPVRREEPAGPPSGAKPLVPYAETPEYGASSVLPRSR
jgi:hypothetical protein